MAKNVFASLIIHWSKLDIANHLVIYLPEEMGSEEDNKDNEVKYEDGYAFCSTRSHWDRDVNIDSISYSYWRENMKNVTVNGKENNEDKMCNNISDKSR